jgi:peptide/nickel transport system substrate-binding protein
MLRAKNMTKKRCRNHRLTTIVVASAIIAFLITLSGVENLFAQSHEKVLRAVTQDVINRLDVGKGGHERAVYGIMSDTYDRLVTWERDHLGNGFYHYAPSKPKGELAERWEFSENKRTVTFYLRKGATFHDGSPVTAHDVKWSLDRAVTLPTQKTQAKVGGLVDPKQFKVIDDHTIQITTEKPNRFTINNLGVNLLPIVNSKLAKKHASADDPWGTEYCANNDCGGGAYKVTSWTPNEQIILDRHDGWKGGEQPYFERVILQTIPESPARAAQIYRDRADLCADLVIRDFLTFGKKDTVKTASIPMGNAVEFIAFNSQGEPFKDRKLRQAIAHAMPWDEIYKIVYFERGIPLWGGKSAKPSDIKYPQPFPYKHDLEKAKQLLNEAGYPNGLKTTFSFSVPKRDLFQPLAELVKNRLRDVNIKVEILKIPGDQMGSLMTERRLPLYAEVSNAWLGGIPDYWFRIFYSGNWRWNYGNYHNAELNKILEDTQFESNPQVLRKKTLRMIELAFRDIPIMPIRIPVQNVVCSKDIEGYTYWYHGQMEYRHLKRSK